MIKITIHDIANGGLKLAEYSNPGVEFSIDFDLQNEMMTLRGPMTVKNAVTDGDVFEIRVTRPDSRSV